MSDFSGKEFLITGAGSLGLALTELLLNQSKCQSIRLLDNSEHAYVRAKRAFGAERVRLLAGDVRDPSRVKMAMRGVDYVIHTAALKSVDVAQENPMECVRVNIEGTFNVIEQAWEQEPEKCLLLSSDKAILDSDAGVYHASKHIVEKVMVWANQHSPKTKFACMRPCNFVPSDLAVFDVWFDAYKAGQPIPITDERMERYFIPIGKAAALCLDALNIMEGGETFVTEGTLYNMVDLVRRANLEYKIVGLRNGELRLQEKLMSEEEEGRATKITNMWVLR